MKIVRARFGNTHLLESTQSLYRNISTGYNTVFLLTEPMYHHKIDNVPLEFFWLPSDCQSQHFLSIKSYRKSIL